MAQKTKPAGPPILHQRWENLLFLHWPLAPERVSPLLPRGLTLDTFDGRAWLSVTPFWTSRMRPRGMPPIPLLSDSHELNVRTYVRAGSVPGVWFLSMDASNPIPVIGARLGFSLPYYLAWMRMSGSASDFRFQSIRIQPGAPAADLDVAWTRGARLPPPDRASLEFFLVERYSLYTLRFGRVLRGPIAHRRWPLHRAEVSMHSSSVFTALGLDEPVDPPLAHAQGKPLDVDIWPLEPTTLRKDSGSPVPA